MPVAGDVALRFLAIFLGIAAGYALVLVRAIRGRYASRAISDLGWTRLETFAAGRMVADGPPRYRTATAFRRASDTAWAMPGDARFPVRRHAVTRT